MIRGANTMATLELDDRDFPCTCSVHRPNLHKRKTRSPAPAPTIPIRELAAVLTALRPNLISTARRQLQNRGLDEQLAEDLVQEAIARWCARAREFRDHHQLYGWLRKTISWLAAEGLRRRDLLDRGCASLDEPWART